MTMEFKLNEQELLDAIAQWASARFRTSIEARNVKIAIRKADEDPRSPRPEGIESVIIQMPKDYGIDNNPGI